MLVVIYNCPASFNIEPTSVNRYGSDRMFERYVVGVADISELLELQDKCNNRVFLMPNSNIYLYDVKILHSIVFFEEDNYAR